MNDTSRFQMQVIGHIRSCYSEKFGAPRQPGLAPSARGMVVLEPPFHNPQAFTELQQFSHIWVLFIFHQAQRETWTPSVRPPRLGGNKRIGVFASRSPFRPNPIGMSPLKLERIEFLEHSTRLHVSGLDLVDGTPVVDIKPYIPYVDSIQDACGGYADAAPATVLSVEFREAALTDCRALEPHYPGLEQLIRETLSADPRPAYQGQIKAQREAREYGVKLYDLNIRWKVQDGVVQVLSIKPVEED